MFLIIWPENKAVTAEKIKSWYDDAVANEECEAGLTDPKLQAEALSDAGLITLRRET